MSSPFERSRKTSTFVSAMRMKRAVEEVSGSINELGVEWLVPKSIFDDVRPATAFVVCAALAAGGVRPGTDLDPRCALDDPPSELPSVLGLTATCNDSMTDCHFWRKLSPTAEEAAAHSVRDAEGAKGGSEDRS